MHNLPALPDLRLFCLILRRGSLAGAAAELGASPSFVSKRVAALEAVLGARLLHRTTRRITPTDEGEAVHRWAQRILADVNEMGQEVAASGQPRGALRVSASPGFGRRHVAPALSEFAGRYEDIEVHLEILDRPVDPVTEGYDVDIRVGGLRNPHLHARRLADNRRVLCAAPGYLAGRGLPASPAELSGHRCLVIRERDQAFGLWRLDGPDGAVTVRIPGVLSANDGDVITRWCLLGHGIMLRALESGTAGLHVPTGEVREFPTNTSDALTSGGTYAIAGAVERMVQHVRRHCAAEPLCFMTGGAGWKMAPSMSVPFELVDNLIFDGLLELAAVRFGSAPVAA